jgi:hypothetical protein
MVVFVIACAAMAAIVVLALAFKGMQDANHSPGASCTVEYPDGSTAPGTIQPDGTCVAS